MKYYIISGETSGDQHGAELIKAIRKLDSGSRFRGMGGDESQKAGLDLCMHQRDIAFMGFAEVIQNLKKILSSLKRIKKDIEEFAPDKIILIDYPGFNLKIAKFGFNAGFEVHYYIAPKVWAWKENRIKSLIRYVKQVYCILPFEEEYFKSKGLNAIYVGNPSKQKVDAFLKEHELHPNKTIALLPGSRKQEIETSLPIMLKLKEFYPDWKFTVSQAPGFNEAYYLQFDPSLELNSNMYSLLANSELALVTSGTATLETALLNIPQIVCYQTSTITYHIAKRFIKLKYISLVNLILNKKAIPELIQSDFNIQTILREVKQIVEDHAYINQLHQDYETLHVKIGNNNPSLTIAQLLIQNN